MGLTLPAVSAFDPPVAGEGSLDPMGLAGLSDRLAELLVPGLRARMRPVRFVTAIAVGALAAETLAEEPAADGVSSPAICFEWLVVEAFVRRIDRRELPLGIPGSFKAQTVLTRGQRLAARRPTSRARPCSGSTASTSRSPCTPGWSTASSPRPPAAPS